MTDRWQELTFLFGQSMEKRNPCQEKMAEMVIPVSGIYACSMSEVNAFNKMKLHTNSGTWVNFVTSTGPLSVIFSSGTTGSARKDNAMQGS